MPDLREMLEKRQGSSEMFERDYAYSVFDAYIMSRRSKKGEPKALPQLTYKPFSTARFEFQTPKDHKLAINLSRKVHSYFTSTFSKVPLLTKMPTAPDAEEQKTADRISMFLQGVLNMSRVKAAQPRAASWLSNRGDTVFGVDWDPGSKEIYVRTFDPMWCYPSLDPFDVGGVADMLITFSVPKQYAEDTYQVTLEQAAGESVQVYIFWDSKQRIVQVDKVKAEKFTFEHQLGRCPFRWVFGNADGMYGQSDIRDVPSLQDFYNENLLLAMDTIRKQVDASWIIFGHNKEIVPTPGKAVSVPRQDAKLERFDAGGDPNVIMSVMQMLESGIESSTGISPVSSRGAVAGSASGAAVRNQVQAMEARNEARKGAFEDAYEQIGVLVLQVLRRCMDGKPVKVLHQTDQKEQQGYVEISGEDVGDHFLCLANYSGFLGMSQGERIQASLQGLGRLYGLPTAIRLADIPGTNAAALEKEVDAYQRNLAVVAATSQAVAQQAAQAAQPTQAEGGQPQMDPNAMPQRPQGAPPPGPQQRGMTSLGDIERTLEVLKPKLRGQVWAVGELALAGMAEHPMVMVANERDLAAVTLVMQHLNVSVLPGHPGEMPNLQVA